jgi:hypothetical protein
MGEDGARMYEWFDRALRELLFAEMEVLHEIDGRHADETISTMCADAAVKRATAVWTSESKRIRRDLHWRYCAATSVG